MKIFFRFASSYHRFKVFGGDVTFEAVVVFQIARSHITEIGINILRGLLTTNTEDILKRVISDPEVLAFFNMLTCTYCYTTAAETPAILSAAMFVDNHEGGIFYPCGSTQMLPNKLEKAIEVFESVRKEMPGNIILLNNLGAAYRETGRLGKAKEIFEEGLRIQPQNHLIRQNLDQVNTLLDSLGG